MPAQKKTERFFYYMCVYTGLQEMTTKCDTKKLMCGYQFYSLFQENDLKKRNIYCTRTSDLMWEYG